MDPRYPIGDFVMPKDVTPARRRQAIDEIASTPKKLRAAVNGLNDTQLDTDLDLARNSADLTARAHEYTLADQRLAALLPAIPLYQQVIVNTYSSSLYGVEQNDLVADFDTAAWYCSGGNCAG